MKKPINTARSLSISKAASMPLQPEAASIQAATLKKAEKLGMKAPADAVKDVANSNQTGLVRDVNATETEEVETPPTPVVEAQPTFTIADLNSAITQAVTSALAGLQEQTKEQIEAAKKQASTEVEKAKAEADAKLAELQKQAAQQINAIQEKLEATEQDKQALEGVFKLNGRANPEKQVNFNQYTNPNKSEPQGAALEILNLLNQSKASYVMHNGLNAVQRDTKEVSRFINECRTQADKSGSNSWLKDIEAYAKAHGYLNGNRDVQAQAGATTGAAGLAPNAFLDILSAMMRESHNQANVFWQFTTTVFDPTSAPSKNILIPRTTYLDAPTAAADYLLSDTTTFNAIPYVTGSSSDAQSLVITTVPVGIGEYGLGKSGATGTRPVYIPEFHLATSLIDLMAALDISLMQNYYAFENFMIQAEFQKATTIYYNNGGVATSTAADVVAGSGGLMTKEYLDSVYSLMLVGQIPAFPDGCYGLVINPYARAQLLQSLGNTYRAPSPEQVSALTSMMRAATGVEIGRVSGYMGMYCGFHIWVSNTIGVGAPTTNTVNTVTLGGALGAKTTNDSFAFGIGSVGRGIALPMEIRPSGLNQFGRGESYIWLSREGYSAIDVDSSSSAPSGQQTRVVRARTLRAAV